MINFNGIDNGVLGKPVPADSTLKNMRKEKLIDMLHMAQNNYEVLRMMYKTAISEDKCNRCPLMCAAEVMMSELPKVGGKVEKI